MATKHLVPILALVLLVPAGATSAAAEPKNEGPATAGASTERIDPAPDKRPESPDELAGPAVSSQIGNHRLGKSLQGDYARDEITNDSRQTVWMIQDTGKIDQPRPIVEISKLDEARMNMIMLALVDSDLPLVGAGIDRHTGKISIEVDSEKDSPSTKNGILAITGDVPIDITYVKSYASGDYTTHQPDIAAQWSEKILLKILLMDAIAQYLLQWLETAYSEQTA